MLKKTLNLHEVQLEPALGDGAQHAVHGQHVVLEVQVPTIVSGSSSPLMLKSLDNMTQEMLSLVLGFEQVTKLS